MTGADKAIKTAFSKEGLINGGKVLGGLVLSEGINFGGDYAVRKASKDKYKMPRVIGGATTALTGALLKEPIIAAAGLGDAGINLAWDLLGVNVLDPVGSAKKLAGDVAEKTTDGAAPSLNFAT